jgi:hypothetical protein
VDRTPDDEEEIKPREKHTMTLDSETSPTTKTAAFEPPVGSDNGLQNMLRQSVLATLLQSVPPAFTVFIHVALVLADAHIEFFNVAFSGEEFARALEYLQKHGLIMVNQDHEFQLTAAGLTLAQELEEKRVEASPGCE